MCSEKGHSNDASSYSRVRQTFYFHLFSRSTTLWSQGEMHISDLEWSWPKVSCCGSVCRSDHYIFNIHQTQPLKNQHIQNLLLKKINLSLQSITYVPENGPESISWQGRVKDVMAMAMVIQNLKLYFSCRTHDICNAHHQYPTVHERQDTYTFIKSSIPFPLTYWDHIIKQDLKISRINIAQRVKWKE